MRHDAKIDHLKDIPLFAEVERRHLDRIASLCTEVKVEAGRVLCREGEIGREFFIIESGTAVVSVGGEQVATLGAGEFFGELALLDGKERNATVTAETDMQLLVLSHQEFDGLVREEPGVAARMLPAIGARLRADADASTQTTPIV